MLMLVAVAFAGCYDYDYDAMRVDPVRVDMAFSLSGSTANKTRMTNTEPTTVNLSILHILPFISSTYDFGLIGGAIEPVGKNALFYKYCTLSQGVNMFRVYAKANGTQGATNGWLVPSFPATFTNENVESVTFSLRGMIDGDDEEAKAAALAAALDAAAPLATYLTNIANATVTFNNTECSWQDSDNSILKKLFDNFINKKNGEINVIAGSAANVIEWGRQLKIALNAQLDAQSFPENSKEKAICEEIVRLCDATSTITGNKYPRSKDLPDGAAVLKWKETTTAGIYGFTPETQTTTLSDINTITRYAYPPELYYYVESGINTSNTAIDLSSLNRTYIDDYTWDDVLSNYFQNANAEITKSTKGIALTNPLQFGVAQLKVTIRANALTLDDGKKPNAGNITIGTDKFPLKGIIVGGQRTVDYQFKQTNDDNTGVKFVYDSQVNTNSGADFYLEYLDKSPTNGPTTLVLQSYDNEAVTIILEFENKSGSQFYGVNEQIIYPNTRFYLVGTIPPQTYDGIHDYTKRVFTKDYTTLVNVTVSSLEKAYNVLPNILSSNLEIGVETTPKWIAATPTTVILE